MWSEISAGAPAETRRDSRRCPRPPELPARAWRASIRFEFPGSHQKCPGRAKTILFARGLLRLRGLLHKSGSQCTQRPCSRAKTASGILLACGCEGRTHRGRVHRDRRQRGPHAGRRAVQVRGDVPRAASGSTVDDAVLPGWVPCRLPNGNWGARYDAPAILPPELAARRIVVRTKQGRMFTTRVREVVTRSADRVLVRDTGFPV